jgi:hypothetical protein
VQKVLSTTSSNLHQHIMACLAWICPSLFGSSSGGSSDADDEASTNPLVIFSGGHKSKECVVSQFCISGTGIALANTLLLQTRAYFELTIVELPDGSDFRVGVGGSGCYAQPEWVHLGQHTRSWAMGLRGSTKDASSASSSSSSSVDSAATEEKTDGRPALFKAGDVIGVTLDLSEKPVVEFYKNGVLIPDSKMVVKGEVYPAASVSGGCMLEANFGRSSFLHGPPPKFDAVIYVKSLL